MTDGWKKVWDKADGKPMPTPEELLAMIMAEKAAAKTKKNPRRSGG